MVLLDRLPLISLVQNGGYENPPRVKRAFRDPRNDWWDKQERRNFGEPVHEENEILGVFSPEQYTHVSAGKGFFHLGVFVATFLGFCGVVSFYYPDKPSAPRTFSNGLEKELGGPNATQVCCAPLLSYASWCADWVDSRLASLGRNLGNSIGLCCVNKYDNVSFWASIEGLIANVLNGSAHTRLTL